MAKQITGAVGIGETVYRAGQEAEMEAAASAAGIDLADARFGGALSGYDAARPSALPKTDAPKADAPKTPAPRAKK